MVDIIKKINNLILSLISQLEHSDKAIKYNTEQTVNKIENLLLSLPNQELADSRLEIEFNPNLVIYTKNIICAVLKCLDSRWRIPIIINISIKSCHKELEKIGKLMEFSKVLTLINAIINLFPKWSSPSSVSSLSFLQIKTFLPILFKGLSAESTFIIRYASRCLNQCLEKISVQLFEQTELSHSAFLNLMDAALNSLDNNSKSENFLPELKKLIDEILHIAMSTVQVVINDEDKKAITAYSQKILSEFKDAEGFRDDKNLFSLNVSNLSQALTQLERQVNLAILKLVLHVLSGVNDPFRSLMDKVKCSESPEPSELDDLIADFDLEMDRIMQIGSFAVACSSNVIKAIEMNCCLASFESLESELVPCITAFHVDRSQLNQTNLWILTEFWLEQMQQFKNILFSIIDPVAFTEIVKCHLQNCANDIKLKEDYNDLSHLINEFIKVGKTVIRVLQMEQQYFANKCLLLDTLINEINRTNDVYGKWKENKDNFPKLEIRLGKILKIIEEIFYILAKDANKTVVNDTLTESYKLSCNSTNSDFYKLVKISTSSANPLTPFIKNVKSSVFYETPKRSLAKAKFTPAKTPSSRHPNSCFRQIKAIQFDLTDILENLTQHNETFSTPCAGKKLTFDSNLDFESFINETLSNFKNPEFQEIDTPERFKDLIALGNKIKCLKYEV